MKIVFFDILKDNKKSIKVEKYINTFGESIYVYLNENIIVNESIFAKLKNKLLEKYIKNIFKSKKFTEPEYMYITSYDLDKNTTLKEKLISFLDDRFFQVIEEDTIKKNSIKYMKNYSKDLRLLCIISENIDITILLRYLEKFKIVDFLYIGKKDINFLKNINNINMEYGSTVSFVTSKDLTIYDVYIIFNNVDLNGYMLNKRSKCLNLTSSDEDIYSKEYKIYSKYSKEIVNKENYSKTRIGKLICTYLTDSV